MDDRQARRGVRDGGGLQGPGRRHRSNTSTSTSRRTSPSRSGFRRSRCGPGIASVVHHVLAFYRAKPDMQRAARAAVPTASRWQLPPSRTTGTSAATRGSDTEPLARDLRAGHESADVAGRALRFDSSRAASSSSRCTTRPTARRRLTARGSGCIFAKDPSPREVRVTHFFNGTLTLPAGVAGHACRRRRRRSCSDAIVWGIFPHTHVRGKKWEYMLELPDGTKKSILSVPTYDFNWQTYYMFTEPLQVPKGARLVSSAWYDNSAANQSNPDPEGGRQVGRSDLGGNAVHRSALQHRHTDGGTAVAGETVERWNGARVRVSARTPSPRPSS